MPLSQAGTAVQRLVGAPRGAVEAARARTEELFMAPRQAAPHTVHLDSGPGHLLEGDQSPQLGQRGAGPAGSLTDPSTLHKHVPATDILA